MEYKKEDTLIITKIKHDGSITLATGKSKKETHWKNKTIMYSDLIKKLSTTTRTPETYAEYKKLPKTERDNLKDVGGFVGGSLKNGRRKAENVANRTLLTLDLDYVKGDIWSSIELLWDFSVTMYSTHTHAPDNQRLRLVIPLSRPVLPDEYQAVSRMVADDLGIDQFDDTTYEPSRLMYWPSTSSDGEYVFKVQDLQWLNPDEVLARYTFGWQDVSYWPESSRARAKITSAIKKQEDPLEKKGVIGAFCRTYTITEAIGEFLNEIYVPGTDETRYTYSEGSTTGGVVVYEDKFSFSHHGTDPTSGILCNAFDLVRIHKFSSLDDEAKADTPVNRLPSFTRMSEFASNNEKVMETLGREKLEKAQEDFGVVETDVDIDTKWLKELTYTEQGKLRSTISNFLLIIENEPLLKGKIAYNEFSNRAVVIGQLPWRSKNNKSDWNDTDDSGLREFIEKYYSISSTAKCADALALSFEKHSFHPVKEYLNNLVWDGKERVSTLFIDYLGAEDNSYVRTVTRKIIVAAVARIFVPGIKFDNMPVLSGPQGIYKSTIIKKLGMEWYSDSLTTVSGKEAYEQLQGVWLLEMGEMMATKKADIEATKHFLSKTEDIYRVAYGRRTSRFPRQCIFIGTTNDREFLRDKTGNRRFWPIDVGIQKTTKKVYGDLDNEIDQIWAEAVELWNNKEPLHLNKEELKEAERQQDSHSEESAKAGLIEEYLNKPITDNWYNLSISEKRSYIQGSDFGDIPEGNIRRDKTCVMEIWVELFNGDPKQLNPMQSREINDILKGIEGWKSYEGRLRFGKIYGTQRAFIRE
ncbi:putative virulence-associated protein E [Clostridium pasteurianum DSM 525 = ATCC 6013]|uniref:Putative virulence-associated protein E n=1 Tax=Clostridium pasteurianum DSM 525 = ATCC 6013 TaxID=1262449 RepID=A0A0H3J9N1_CLOPA|nr:virulence-associated E family protein [Clostridium pasteurianum]AJA50077.1 putative virulence-associated protein E [Clostridium pasteurianum DSM 525 = ATCC 6013]AJA54065.1 putative virulence-associated protein E [Clostridium pasteurianum DSM 525 = ATCC 6013]ELP59220.1 putative virulence-associated protein E [Clostridium pasteurianum DSM 525 = ATCC 6013]KRU13910.1 virulence-associated E family protein [Clostridium pasteurianum DSM 525 = ATCC 6013]